MGWWPQTGYCCKTNDFCHLFFFVVVARFGRSKNEFSCYFRSFFLCLLLLVLLRPCSVGIDVGACVALQFAHLSHKPTAVRLKSLGFEPPMPLCAAMILESPAIAPAVGIAASMLQFSAPPEPFVGVRKLLNDIVIPVFVAVGSRRTMIDSTLVSVCRIVARCLFSRIVV